MSLSVSIPLSTNPQISTPPPTTEKGPNDTKRLYLWDFRLNSEYGKNSQGNKLLKSLTTLHKSMMSTEFLQWLSCCCGCLLCSLVSQKRCPSPVCEHCHHLFEAEGQDHHLLNSKTTRKLPPIPWMSGRKPTLKNENLCSTVDALIMNGALIACSRDFLFGFHFRAEQI